jgi:mono/diheme cytochrome c family protein
MNRSGAFSRECIRVGLIGILLAGIGCAGLLRHGHAGMATAVSAPTPPIAIQPLSADDVSWLFPPPTKAEDFAEVIAVRDLTTSDPRDPTKRDPVWPDAAFQQFLEITASAATQVDGTPSRIGLPAEAQTIDGWFIAGIRIDAGAPGLSNEIRGQFGQSPEIRLIVQPVTRNADGTPKVDDIAAHLIFDFTLPPQAKPDPGCFPRQVPDLAAFNAIVSDLAALRTKLSNGQLGADKVITAGVPLGIHPGLADATTAKNVRNEIVAFLEGHLSGQHLNAMAIAGLPAGAHAPWIFLSMLKVPAGVVPALPNGGFVPVNGPTLDGKQFAQMLQPAGTVPRVLPAPHTNNLNPITCVNAAVPGASLPIAKRSGVSTADLASTSPTTAERTKTLLDVVADPTKSQFFNTDCVSCHTETRRAMELLNIKSIPGIDPAALPNGTWDVRNFGWAPAGRGATQATATRRTAAETAAVVAYINSEVLAKQQH